MSNTVATLGVNAINKSRQANVEAHAMTLINAILATRKSIKSNDKAIADEQAKLVALGLDVVSQKDVLNTEWTGELNINQVTILNALKKLNDARQESVSVQSQGHINRIEQYRATNKALNEQLDKHVKELTELGVDVVTVADVTGAAH